MKQTTQSTKNIQGMLAFFFLVFVPFIAAAYYYAGTLANN